VDQTFASCRETGWPEEFVKNRSKCKPSPFLSNLMYIFLRGKSTPKNGILPQFSKNCLK
jgi:hypothetical protein